MTREEAIDRLRKISEKTPIRTNGDDLVAITMAIQALSQEPRELLIIKSNILLHQDDRKKWAESIKREKESGVIILPPYFEPLLVPADIEIKADCGAKMGSEDLGDYPDTIHNQFDNMTGAMNL